MTLTLLQLEQPVTPTLFETAQLELAAAEQRVEQAKKSLWDFRSAHMCWVNGSLCIAAEDAINGESLNREHQALLVEFDAAVRHRDHLLENFCAARRAAGLAHRGLADEEREKRGARNVLNEGTKNTGLERAAQPQELPAALATFQKNITPKIRFLVGATDDELVAALTRFCAIPAIRANFLRQNPHYSNLTDGWGCRRG